MVILSLAMTVIPFLPATNLFIRVGFVIAERVLYLPSAGYCLLVAVGATKSSRYFSKGVSRGCRTSEIAMIVELPLNLVLYS